MMNQYIRLKTKNWKKLQKKIIRIKNEMQYME